MKILLCDPPGKESHYYAAFPNLGILYLASALRRRLGASCRVLYLDAHRDLKEHLRAVDRFRPDVYGLSFSFPVKSLAYEVVSRVKAEFRDLPVVCGGPMPSAAAGEVLARSPTDICVLGEGEEVIGDLVDHFRGKGVSLERIPGIAFRMADGAVVETAKRKPFEDLDRIPFPAWDLVDFSKYAGWFVRRARPQAHIFINRGCPFDCNYCSNPVWKYAKPWVRLRSPGNIAGEVRLLHDLGAREIYLSSDEFNVDVSWALEVCRAIEALGLKDAFFNCNLRPGAMTPELARAFKKINLWIAHLGIESGNQRTLDGVGKKTRLEDIVESCRILKNEGLMIFGFVMLFHAWEENGRLCWETAEDVDRTLDFCRFLFRERLLDYMSCQVTTPMPGSRLWATALRHGLLPRHEIKGTFKRNMILPGVGSGDVQRAIRRGFWLKNAYLFRNGHFSLRHLAAGWTNLRLMLGLGLPRRFN